MSNRNGRVVTSQQGRQSLVHKCLGLGVEGARRFVKDENVRILEQCTGNGNALLLTSRELSTSRADMCFETIGLNE